jgi:SOS-response transcriptional repressor LexA
MYALIPIDLCYYAISKKFDRPFQLYIYLKYKCSGKIKLSNADFKNIAKDLGLKSEKTITNNLKILIQNNWVGYNKKSGYYFIRNYKRIKNSIQAKSNTCAEFNTNEIKNFKGFVAGACIGYLVNQQKRKIWLTESKNRDSKPISQNPIPDYYPVANHALAQIWKVAISTAFELKKLAHKKEYISVKKEFQLINVSINFKKQFQKSNPEIAHKVRVKNNKLFLQEADKIMSKIRFKSSRKKPKHI